MSDEYTVPENDAPDMSQGTDTKVVTMHLKIYSPYKVYFDGEALSVSAESLTGPFDVLPKHHNFITLLEPCDTVVRTTKGEQTIRISGGVMHVKANDVVVFLDV